MARDGYHLCECSKLSKSKELNVSLRDHKDVDYSPMLTSDVESEPEPVPRKPKNIRPSANGPSALRQHAIRHVGISKTFHTKTPTHSYPIRGYKRPSEAANTESSNTLPVETEQEL